MEEIDCLGREINHASALRERVAVEGDTAVDKNLGLARVSEV